MADGTTSRREFVAGSGAAAVALTLRYAPAAAQASPATPYGAWEDLMRAKWTWDRVARGTHGTNCTGNCAFNVYVKNGIVWREEQQGEYGRSEDAPDYGPRGCQKGLRHAKYMYGKQRVLYPMKRVGARGEGKWQRISWDQAMAEIADRFIDHSVQSGPRSISFDLGTQMVLKRASFAALGRLAVISGIELPEAFAGVGDLPTGVHMTVGEALLGDTMAAVYKSKCCLVWFCNPAVTRIPDAHFFWEARYNGTEVIAISPEFTPTAMHASKWLNPKPGTDTALAMAMVQVILAEKLYDTDYIREQTDLPFLVRSDTGEFLRERDFKADGRDNLFYVWDEATRQAVPAPGTGNPPPPPGSPVPVIPGGTLQLGAIRPALEGQWKVKTAAGRVPVTTVFELLKKRAVDYVPEKATQTCGVHPDNIRQVARTFAAAKPAMIFTGYRMCKWLHGDLLQRSFMLLLSLTGNLGKAGGGFQLENLGRTESQLAFMFAGLPPTLRVATMARWDYVHANGQALNEKIYGKDVADHIDRYYQESNRSGAWPDYTQTPWKMAIFAGSNTANWRSAGGRWRKEALATLETIVTLTPDMGITAMYSDYVLPIAHHYERKDYMLEARTPYVQVLDEAVAPLGESVDDWHALERLTRAISERARVRGIAPIQDSFFGQPVPRDFTQYHALYTHNGKFTTTEQVIDWLIALDEGVPKVPFRTLAAAGKLRNLGTDRVVYAPESPYGSVLLRAVEKHEPYPTLTGRQQYYIDHPWFVSEDEVLPRHKDPLSVPGAPLRLLMGHVRHGIHSMWTDDPLLMSLRRGQPDIYISPLDAAARGVKDGDAVRVFNRLGEFQAMAHVTSAMQPGALFMYHGWDPMLFKDRQNFGAVISSAALIKPTSLVSGYGHVTYRALAFEPNSTHQDLTCEVARVG
ncbi:MAG: molybdopterin-dependent oxidoreductase [Chromatiales bacterium]|jgi:DMSO reductase family type II enzyme molybdopterin subunit|nr:molybdopterin-dependent oxidoreductase [Chromatiales bacterium]